MVGKLILFPSHLEWERLDFTILLEAKSAPQNNVPFDPHQGVKGHTFLRSC